MPETFIWTILLTKSTVVIFMTGALVSTFLKYKERKTKITLWMGITIFTYLIGMILTLLNTILYIAIDLPVFNILPMFNGIFMGFASTALFKFTYEVFSSKENEGSKIWSITIYFQFLLLMFLSIFSIITYFTNSLDNYSLVAILLMVVSFINYLITIFNVSKIIIKLKKTQEKDSESYNKLKSLLYGTITILFSVILVVLDYLLAEYVYTWLNPLGFLIMTFGMWFLNKVVK